MAQDLLSVRNLGSDRAEGRTAFPGLFARRLTGQVVVRGGASQHENALLVFVAAAEAAGRVEVLGAGIVGEDPHLGNAGALHPLEHLPNEGGADTAPAVVGADADRVEEELRSGARRES